MKHAGAPPRVRAFTRAGLTRPTTRHQTLCLHRRKHGIFQRVRLMLHWLYWFYWLY